MVGIIITLLVVAFIVYIIWYFVSEKHQWKCRRMCDDCGWATEWSFEEICQLCGGVISEEKKVCKMKFLGGWTVKKG